MSPKRTVILLTVLLFVPRAFSNDIVVLAEISSENEACRVFSESLTGEIEFLIARSGEYAFAGRKNGGTGGDLVLQGSVVSTGEGFKAHMSALDTRTGGIVHEVFEVFAADAEKTEIAVAVRRFMNGVNAARKPGGKPGDTPSDRIAIGLIAGFPGAAISVKYYGITVNLGGIYNVLFQTQYGVLAEAGLDLLSGELFPGIGFTLGLAAGGFLNLNNPSHAVYARLPVGLYWSTWDLQIFAEIAPAAGTTFAAGGFMPVAAAGVRYVFR